MSLTLSCRTTIYSELEKVIVLNPKRMVAPVIRIQAFLQLVYLNMQRKLTPFMDISPNEEMKFVIRHLLPIEMYRFFPKRSERTQLELTSLRLDAERSMRPIQTVNPTFPIVLVHVILAITHTLDKLNFKKESIHYIQLVLDILDPNAKWNRKLATLMSFQWNMDESETSEEERIDVATIFSPKSLNEMISVFTTLEETAVQSIDASASKWNTKYIRPVKKITENQSNTMQTVQPLQSESTKVENQESSVVTPKSVSITQEQEQHQRQAKDISKQSALEQEKQVQLPPKRELDSTKPISNIPSIPTHVLSKPKQILLKPFTNDLIGARFGYHEWIMSELKLFPVCFGTEITFELLERLSKIQVSNKRTTKYLICITLQLLLMNDFQNPSRVTPKGYDVLLDVIEKKLSKSNKHDLKFFVFQTNPFNLKYPISKENIQVLNTNRKKIGLLFERLLLIDPVTLLETRPEDERYADIQELLGFVKMGAIEIVYMDPIHTVGLHESTHTRSMQKKLFALLLFYRFQ